MAKAFLRARLQDRGCDAVVASAGFLTPGVKPPEEVVDAMEDHGIDLTGHRSRQVTAELVAGADLVATMTRQQLVEVVTMAGDWWSRCFTLTDLVRRAETAGPPSAGEPVQAWVRRLHSARSRTSLLSLDLDDDIADPMNSRRSAYSRRRSTIWWGGWPRWSVRAMGEPRFDRCSRAEHSLLPIWPMTRYGSPCSSTAAIRTRAARVSTSGTSPGTWSTPATR
ncbi:MAG: hypothetical protein M3256_07110 [Actinomycetota bacterium]|nr:hypothetical protein [Actinomycetota bacterium]